MCRVAGRRHPPRSRGRATAPSRRGRTAAVSRTQRSRPPGSSSASTTVGRWPWRITASAALRPAGPAPTIDDVAGAGRRSDGDLRELATHVRVVEAGDDLAVDAPVDALVGPDALADPSIVSALQLVDQLGIGDVRPRHARRDRNRPRCRAASAFSGRVTPPTPINGTRASIALRKRAASGMSKSAGYRYEATAGWEYAGALMPMLKSRKSTSPVSTMRLAMSNSSPSS